MQAARRAAMPDVGAFVLGPPVVRAPTGSGVLDGLSFAVKDLIDVAGVKTGGGNPDWHRHAAPALRSAPVVDRLLSAGARLAGKTITDELAFSLEGANAHHGTPLNSRAPDRLPGGSSSGSAAAVAAGLVDFALGTDTGGSVRIPASFCGLYGFRPSHGAIPLAGVIPFAPSYDTVGWFARDAVTLSLVGDVLLPAGDGPVLREIRLASDAFALAEPEVAAALLRFATGWATGPAATVFDGGERDWLECYRVLQGAEIWQSLGPAIERRRPTFGSAIGPRFAEAATIEAADVARWQPFREACRERLSTLMRGDTVLVIPTSPTPALSRGAAPAELGAFYPAALTLTAIAGHAGLPQVTIPGAEMNGVPVGLSLVGPAGSDRALLAMAMELRIPDGKAAE